MEPGTPIRVEMTKWGDRPHWEFEGIHLGSDEHGEWLGFPLGTHNHRPDYEFHSKADCVTLVPTGGWYAATFHAPGIWCDLYVDITTPGRRIELRPFTKAPNAPTAKAPMRAGSGLVSSATIRAANSER